MHQYLCKVVMILYSIEYHVPINTHYTVGQSSMLLANMIIIVCARLLCFAVLSLTRDRSSFSYFQHVSLDLHLHRNSGGQMYTDYEKSLPFWCFSGDISVIFMQGICKESAAFPSILQPTDSADKVVSSISTRARACQSPNFHILYQ